MKTKITTQEQNELTMQEAEYRLRLKRNLSSLGVPRENLRNATTRYLEVLNG